MKFTKMQGAGNDYVYVNGFKEKVENRSEFAIKVSDRNFGVGADGAIFINPSKIADCEMEMYNADGSRSEMCGNGIRCVAKFVYDYGIIDKTEISIESMGVVRIVKLSIAKEQPKELTGVKFGKRADGMVVEAVRVDMGEPIFNPADVPVDPSILDGYGNLIEEKVKTNNNATNSDYLKKVQTAMDSSVDGFTPLHTESEYTYPIRVCRHDFDMTCVSMGNPHAVMFVDNVKEFPLNTVGPRFEFHPCFPKRVNAEFARIIDRENIEMRVWERGTGETLACGTGATATGVAAMLCGLTDRKVNLHLRGGDLVIEWDEKTNHVFMTGPAVTVFEAEI